MQQNVEKVQAFTRALRYGRPSNFSHDVAHHVDLIRNEDTVQGRLRLDRAKSEQCLQGLKQKAKILRQTTIQLESVYCPIIQNAEDKVSQQKEVIDKFTQDIEKVAQKNQILGKIYSKQK